MPSTTKTGAVRTAKHQRRIDEKVVMEILRTTKTVSQGNWAKRLGVSQQSIWSIRNGRTYQDVFAQWDSYRQAVYEASIMERHLRATMSPAAAEILLGPPGRDLAQPVQARSAQQREGLFAYNGQQEGARPAHTLA